MSWWRRLFQRILGSGSEPALKSLPSVDGPTSTPATSTRPDPSELSRPSRTQVSPPSAVRADAAPAALPPVADAPITTPPEAARPVAISLPESIPVPPTPPSLPIPPQVEFLAPARPIAHPTKGAPLLESPPTTADDHFELPDFSHLSYPKVAGGFASPLLLKEGSTREDAGHSRFALRTTAMLLAELSTAQTCVEIALQDEPIVMSLPSRGSSARAYALAPLPPHFVDATRRAPRTLSAALTALDHADERTNADPLDRLELTRLVARLLQGLHDQQHFTTGVDLESFAFSLRPRPAIALLRGDHVRRVGGDFLSDAPSIDTDPSMDNDRHGFAELARQVLVTHDNRSGIIPGLDEEQVRAAESLWARAAGPLGTRPQINEWLAVLG